MAGVGIALGIGLVGGILIGIALRLINKNQTVHQFTDRSYY